MQRRSYDLYQEGRQIVAAGTLGAVRVAAQVDPYGGHVAEELFGRFFGGAIQAALAALAQSAADGHTMVLAPLASLMRHLPPAGRRGWAG